MTQCEPSEPNIALNPRHKISLTREKTSPFKNLAWAYPRQQNMKTKLRSQPLNGDEESKEIITKVRNCPYMCQYISVAVEMGSAEIKTLKINTTHKMRSTGFHP